MIDGRELRKGNIVRRLVHLPIGYNRPMLPFTEITEVKSGYVETTFGTDKYSEIAPIQLSKDILLRSGGKRISDKEILFSENKADTPNFYILMDSDKFYFSKENGEKLSIAIASLHQFQNLYYDITGNEVKIIL
ncbi:hypothetical protein [Prevotella sp. 10(H)]|uniref:hypothetical protein n=1 Tax=Prevotella sp. 10(H) TaxID=1158294 RepID=UPI0004A6E712|nr:hypothetical protein [Prevotella sp. 10(H)]